MAKIIKFLFIIIIFSPWGIVYSKSPPPGTGTADVPANILIMLDKSGSMDWNISGRTTLEDPTDVEVDSNGNIYILEYGRNRITKWNSSGTYIKDIGQTQSCNRWGGSWFFKISDDKIYIADWNRQELLKFYLNGNCIKRNPCLSPPTCVAISITSVNCKNKGFSGVTLKHSHVAIP